MHKGGGKFTGVKKTLWFKILGGNAKGYVVDREHGNQLREERRPLSEQCTSHQEGESGVGEEFSVKITYIS